MMSSDRPNSTRARLATSILVGAAIFLFIPTFARGTSRFQEDGGRDAVPSVTATAADAGSPEVQDKATPAPEPVSVPTPAAAAKVPVPAPANSRAVPGEVPATGEELDELDLASLLENVVVTATKSELREDEAPAITTVVSREEIRRWGYQSVAEVMSHVAGVYIIDDHIIPNLGIRGVSGGLRSESGLVKVMIDGRPVAFRSTAGNWLGPELVPLAAIQQIEIIRGPASALYGADAFLGVINIVTRRPDQMEGGEAAGAANRGRASIGRAQDVAIGATVGRWELLASFATSSEDRSGLRLPASSPAPALPTYAPADRIARNLVLNSKVALGKLTYRIGSRATAVLTGYYSGIDRGAEFADWAQLTHNLDDQGRTNGTHVSLQQGFGNLGLAWQPSQKLSLNLNAMAFTGGPTSRDRIEVGSDIFYARRDFGYRGLDIGSEAAWRPTRSVTALLGAGLIVDDEKRPATYQVTKAMFGGVPAGTSQLESGGGGRVALWNPGVHALVSWSPRPGASLIAGARYDYHNIYGGKPSARLGGVAKLAANLHLKLLYGSAFKAPSPQLLWGSPLSVGDISGNILLKPSYVHTVEGQLSYRPVAFILLTTGLTYSYLLDQAEFAQVGVNQVAQNIAKVESISWESEMRLDWRRKIAAYANLSINRTNHHSDNPGYVAQLTNYANIAYPVAVAHAGTSALLPRLPLRISVEGSFVSVRRSSGTNTLNFGQAYALDEYFLLGGSIRTVGFEVLSQRETIVSITSRNLLGTSAADPGFSGVDYPRLGRTFILQIIQQL